MHKPSDSTKTGPDLVSKTEGPGPAYVFYDWGRAKNRKDRLSNHTMPRAVANHRAKVNAAIWIPQQCGVWYMLVLADRAVHLKRDRAAQWKRSS